MVKAWLHKMERELRETLSNPAAQVTRGQRLLYFCIGLGRHARRELSNHSAQTMAAALTYRTIFGLVPMVVMALIVFRAFGGFAGSQQGLTDLVYEFFDLEEQIARQTVEPDDFVKPPADETTGGAGETESKAIQRHSPFARRFDPTLAQDAATDNGAASDSEHEAELARQRANAEMRRRIDDLVGSLAQGATSISIGGIGVIGMLVLIWAALGLIITVEKTFNLIYDAPSGRPWHLRIPIYWACITLGPVLIWASFYLSTQFVAATQGVVLLGWLVGLVKQFTALLVTWLLFLLLFVLMPNAKVAIRPAMIGAMVSALAWELMKAALRWYIESAVITPTQARLYGSLALIPILLFWVYLTWLVVLAGLEVAHILQTLPASDVGRFKPRQAEPAASVTRDPWLVIPVMSAIAQAFDDGKTLGVDTIADQLGAPVMTVERIADELVGRGLLHRLSDAEGRQTLALAMPPGRIRIADLLAAAPDDAKGADLPGHALLKQLAEAQDKALADVTLAGGVEEGH